MFVLALCNWATKFVSSTRIEECFDGWEAYSDEDALRLPHDMELLLADSNDVASACRSAGISDATYCKWRKCFGGMSKSQLSEMKALEKENGRLKKIVAELELYRLIL